MAGRLASSAAEQPGDVDRAAHHLDVIDQPQYPIIRRHTDRRPALSIPTGQAVNGDPTGLAEATADQQIVSIERQRVYAAEDIATDPVGRVNAQRQELLGAGLVGDHPGRLGLCADGEVAAHIDQPGRCNNDAVDRSIAAARHAKQRRVQRRWPLDRHGQLGRPERRRWAH